MNLLTSQGFSNPAAGACCAGRAGTCGAGDGGCPLLGTTCANPALQSTNAAKQSATAPKCLVFRIRPHCNQGCSGQSGEPVSDGRAITWKAKNLFPSIGSPSWPECPNVRADHIFTVYR